MSTIDEHNAPPPGPDDRALGSRALGPRGWGLETGDLGGIGRRVLPYAFLVALVIFFAIDSSEFLTKANIFNVLRSSSTLMVIAAGATLVVVAGSVDLSVGAVAALSGTVVAYMVAQGDSGAVLLLALPIGVACGLVNAVLAAYAKLPSFVTTLGTLFVFNGLAQKITTGQTESFSNNTLNTLVNGTSIGGLPNIVYWAIAALIITIVLAYWTPFGRNIYAIGGNERMARLSGVPVTRAKVLMFVLSGCFAGAAGLMLDAQGGGSSPGMGDSYLLNAIAAIVIGGTALSGGVGGPARTVIGVLTIAVVSNGMTLLQVDPNLQTMVFGLIVLFAVVVTVRRNELDVVK